MIKLTQASRKRPRKKGEREFIFVEFNAVALSGLRRRAGRPDGCHRHQTGGGSQGAREGRRQGQGAAETG